MPNPSASSGTAAFALSGVSTLDPLLNEQYLKWTVASTPGVELTYSFPWSDGAPAFWQSDYSLEGEPDAAVHFALNAAQQSAAERAMQAWAMVAGITFTEVADTENNVGDFRFAFSSAVADGWGYSGYPNDYWASAADVWISPSVADQTDWTGASYNELALMHEIGHGLGLKHPGNYGEEESGTTDYLPATLDFINYSVMSYNNKNYWFLYPGQNRYTGVFPSTPMVYDIAAIQYLYGVNNTYHTGADTYRFDPATPFFCTLWDAGGNDTLDLSNFSATCTIDLIPGHYSSIRYSSEGTIDDLYDGANNLGIAYGAIIENAVGGSNADIITGNNVRNMLAGGGGNDTFIGSAGNDTLDGGDGIDTAEFSGRYAEYDIRYDPATVTFIVRDTTTSRDGTDSVHFVENLVFADTTILATNTCEFTTEPQTGLTIKGISMSTYTRAGYDGLAYTHLLANALDSGANYVELSSVSVINLDTGEVKEWIKSTDGYNMTASFDSVEHAIVEAQDQGLSVFLKPQINASNPSLSFYTGNEYSNLTDLNAVISDPAAFFAGYKAYILNWAVLAEKYNVPLLSIGNEMLSATKAEYTSYWTDIIASVREVYSGKLTYSAFTEMVYLPHDEVNNIQFWDKLDYVGVDVYPDFPTGTSTPTVAQLDAEWTSQGWMHYLETVAEKTGKELLFTETGASSYAGAANRSTYTDALIGEPDTQRDDVTQANWYQSFIKTWGGAERPDWLAGLFFWNNDPQATGLHYANGYAIHEKAAGIIVTSFFDGTNYLAAAQNSFAGSSSNDNIALYGTAGSVNTDCPVHDPLVTRTNTFTSTVTIYLNGSITNGEAPTVHFYINGTDMGSQELSHIPSSWIDPTGLVSSDLVPFSFQVDSLVIDEIKVAIEPPVIANSQVYIDSVTLNGFSLALSNVSYYPLTGSVESYPLPYGALKNGGYVLIDPSLYTGTLANQPGAEANPITVEGGGGFDTVYMLGAPHSYSISSDSVGVTSLDSHGLFQNAVLTNISAIEFADGSQLTGGHWSTTGESNVPIGNDIVLAFETLIKKGSGTIAIHSGSEAGTIVESYDVATSTNIVFSGSTVTINPSADLAEDNHYVVTFTDGSLTDLTGTTVAVASMYDFTTLDEALHSLTGSVTFWKTGAAIADVTSTIVSTPPANIASESMTTGIDGLYRHLDMADGTYTLTSAKVSGTTESNAIKANDALAALKIAVGMNPNADGSAVSPYQYLAADVNKDGQVKAADALNILKMAVKLSTAPEKEWLFVPESVGSEVMSRTSVVWPDNPISVTLDGDQELDLIGIIKGDVNGSWVA
jgi:serralysin